jgi:signal transduction histidine kinase
MAPLTEDDVITLNRAATVARLLAGVAHEVNNSLLVIGGTAELLEDTPPGAEALAKGLGRIRSQSAKAAAAISDVLSFARDASTTRGRVNLRELVASSVGLRTYAISRAGLKIDFQADGEATFLVQGSRVLLQQAVLNLITNAEQALAGKPGGRIHVELVARDGRAVLSVTDTGAGIPESDRARIFDPFVTTRDRSQSSGLGLAAVRHIAQSHDGAITIADGTAGATFVFDLPLAT